MPDHPTLLSWRSALTFAIILPMTVGFIVGFIVAPFAVGFAAAYEFIADHVEKVHLRNQERLNKLNEQSQRNAT